ncbi:HK97 family phage prohead protease, partial [Streptomyces sp. NRRL S-1896]|uniref:HK97 family phage prohead protease n=1 Tax=Streptomyces sp. NRRL S-1896 TaxID=1463893 RepID=UPI001901A776
GLEVTGQIDDLDANPTAQQVYRLLKGRRVTQFSFAYDVTEGAWVTDDDHPWGGYYELRRLKLHEVGPCLVGANQETELLAAKAHSIARGTKAGRVLSSATPEKAAVPKKTTEASGRPDTAAADGSEPSAQPANVPPAQAPD